MIIGVQGLRMVIVICGGLVLPMLEAFANGYGIGAESVTGCEPMRDPPPLSAMHRSHTPIPPAWR
jgi:hypothetical protein